MCVVSMDKFKVSKAMEMNEITKEMKVKKVEEKESQDSWLSNIKNLRRGGGRCKRYEKGTMCLLLCVVRDVN